MSKTPDTSDNSIDEKLAVIRHILLHGDRTRIEELENIIQNTDLLSEHIDPIIENKIVNIKENFSTTFGNEVGAEFEKKLQLSEDLLLTVLSPMMGKMIRKFISIEMQALKEKIDQQVGRSLSLKRYYHIIRAKVFGIESSALFLADLDDFKTSIRDIFIIQRNSGLSIASAHAEDSQGGDGDIFSGMLTAIKGFGEDVFNKSGREKQELEFIDYESHKILLQSHHNYFFAVLLNGSMSTSEKNKLADRLMNFAGKEKKLNLKNITGEDSAYISDRLKEDFFS